jgi:phosphatidylglycerophosphate synthase
MSAAAASSLLTLPNLLSLSRIPLGGLFWLTLARAPAHAVLPFAVMGAAAATDVLDGYLARRQAGGADPRGTGSWLDPICDKLFVGAVLLSIYLVRRPPLALLALVLTREILQLPMGIIYRTSATLRRWLRYDFRASLLGKAATVAQFLAMSALILNHRLAWFMAEIAFVLGLSALADYVRRAVVIGRRRLSTGEERIR